MTDAEYAEQKARVEALVERWLGTLGLRWWRTEIVYCRKWITDDQGEPDLDSHARTRVHWQYLDAEMQWNMPRLHELSDEQLELIFVHECMHILVNEMRDDKADELPKHEERVATLLAKAFLWVREAQVPPVASASHQVVRINGSAVDVTV